MFLKNEKNCITSIIFVIRPYIVAKLSYIKYSYGKETQKVATY